MNFKHFMTALTLVSCLSLSCLAADHPYKIPPDLDEALKEGLGELYNFNFERSLAIFDSIKDQEEEHPMVAFGVASTHWWRISSYVLEADKDESKAFLEATDNCVKVAEAKIVKGDPTGEAHLSLGGALGLLGRWQATNRQYMSAYFTGKKAYKYLTKALVINPELKDANMGLGIFDYFAATLPAIVRVLSALGKGGDPKIGLGELEEAAVHGIYARTPSKLFLTQIYNEMEHKPEKALEIMLDLRDEYPKSPFIHMMKIIALYNTNRIEELAADAALFEKNISTKYYENDFSAEAHFAMALTFFKLKKWEEAAAQFSIARESGNEKNPWRTWAGLYLGYCSDAMGRREDAVKEYKWVLKEIRRWGSHDLAKSHISRPFKGADEELKKLEL